VRQGPHISAQAKPPPPLPMGGIPRATAAPPVGVPLLLILARPPPPMPSPLPLPLPLSVGEIPWPKIAPPRLEVVLSGRFAGGFGGAGEPIPYWGFFVQRYLTMYYSHERTLAMQHLTVKRVALSMGVADGYRLRAADSEERRNR
jgi:hypothetical protein